MQSKTTESEIKQIRDWIKTKEVKNKHKKTPGKFLGKTAFFQMFENGKRVLLNSRFGEQYNVKNVEEAKELIKKQRYEEALLRGLEVAGFGGMKFDKEDE